MWESSRQPAARWHGHGDGPVQYFANTPDGAWAEFLRHEEITDEKDLAGISRAVWAVELGDERYATPDLPVRVLVGGVDSYAVCQNEAQRMRGNGETALAAPSAALLPSGARGLRVQLGLQVGPAADGQVWVLFGRRPQAVGWLVVDRGAPPADVLHKVRQFSGE